MVRAEAKEILFGIESRSALQKGINKVADTVAVTLGPRGHSVPPPNCPTNAACREERGARATIRDAPSETTSPSLGPPE